ncbi:MAG: aminofutalosine synthase MqnE [Saprospiraceae bacterium]|nr:aminofutalosine synthase MqnE [Saprospiraceae bacterium]MDP4699404.1 aminofutalosine synthase MqnE [Saprospiraceae bacterium]MDP4810884.1 aminofutalosine synthase MqnE [Saprospiraceae bacterium]MDP4813698.1 aminofutalosine synthase MqnE [Saprospiraceae bacterium]MDP4915937.1 aminofutalosine synthase MqnE [Saprospiraceae bacterium]
MENDSKQVCLNNKDIHLADIAKKVFDKKRITPEEGLYLFEHASLGYLGTLANFIREDKNGKNTYFNRNFHIEPTNVCIYTCTFCSYSRLIKERKDGWEYTLDEMMDIVRKYDHEPVTEVHIVGGVLPKYDVSFYAELFKTIKKRRPDLHIKALTPVEYHYIFKKEKISYEEGMALMLEAGLDSMPGGGAEIFHPEIRDQIAGGKCSGEEWLRIHEVWHDLGKKSNATMLYGHIESYFHRIDHLEKLRNLQDKTGGFQTFIPLKFRNKDNQLSHLKEVSALDDLRNYAVSRIYLDNFDHIKAYWPMIGRNMAQLSLSFGVDDIDGTIDDTTKIYSMAGSEEQTPSLSTRDLVNLIKAVGKHPLERDTLYNVLHDYTNETFKEDEVIKGYVSLPVVNN